MLLLVAISVVMLAFSLTFGVLVGLTFALAELLAGGLAGKESQASAIYMMATLRLAMARRLPLRLMTFLDDAHRIGLLRTDGPMYQFRHSALQDFLASPQSSSGGQSTPAATLGA